MIGIVIVANGNLACALLKGLEHVLGSQRNVAAIDFAEDPDRKAKRAEICEAADRVDSGAGVIVVTDLCGSSPCNVCLDACAGTDRQVLAGASLPMLIELVKSRSLDPRQAADRAIDAARKYAMCMKRIG